MSKYLNKMEVMTFRKVIPPNSSDVMQERVKGDGTVEGVRVRFYQGQQKALKVMPFIEHKGAQIENLVTYPATGDNFLSGDDDKLDLPCVISVDANDFIKIRAENTDPTNSYTLAVDVFIDYYGGKDRVIGGVL